MFVHAKLTCCDIAIAAIREKKPHTRTQINAYSQSHANRWVRNVGEMHFQCLEQCCQARHGTKSYFPYTVA